VTVPGRRAVRQTMRGLRNLAAGLDLGLDPT
jgi:hypothetical protein